MGKDELAGSIAPNESQPNPLSDNAGSLSDRAMKDHSPAAHDNDATQIGIQMGLDYSHGSRTNTFHQTRKLERSSQRLEIGSEMPAQERTVISQRPAAAPMDFFRSIPLSDLARMLEGRRLDHFEVQRIIGGGGMGAVFQGLDQRLDRIVAIKVIPGTNRDPETLRRFRQEAQAAARLDHPNIARVYYIGEADQWNYIVFEFIDGVNIRDLVETSGPLPIDDAVFYARQIAEALQHAFQRDVVHRDIKPSNILVTTSGMAKLVDMGLARDTSIDKSTRDETASGVTLGTFDYISPEQARDPRDADVRSDLYSLGCTIFFMLTGHPPFPDGTALQKLLKHGSVPPPDPRGWREDISDQLYEIVMKLVAKRPKDRYQQPIELINDLMLLAEAENLPRSQGPSTISFSPSIDQPGFFESHLPWILAASLLFLSVLWLQSSLTGFALPSLAIVADSGSTVGSPAIAPVEAEPTGTMGRVSDSEALPSAPAEIRTADSEGNGNFRNKQDDFPPAANTDSVISKGSNPRGDEPPSGSTAIQRLIVSPSQPTGLRSELWETSLLRAFQRIANLRGTFEIEIRGTVWLDRKLEMQGPVEIRLRGATPESRIEVGRGLWGTLPGSEDCAIRVNDGSLILEDLIVNADLGESTPAPRSLVRLGGNSSLKLSRTRVTLGSEYSRSAYLLAAIDEGVAISSKSSAAPRTQQIIVEDSFVRGSASFAFLRQSVGNPKDSVQMSLVGSLLAIDGRVLDLWAGTSQVGVTRLVRMFCQDSTVASADGFAKLEFEGSDLPTVGLSRSARSCVFWSQPGTPHLRVFAETAEIDDCLDLLTFQGLDNGYDEGIEDACVFYANNSRVSNQDFRQASRLGWFIERGIEHVVRWQNSPNPLIRMNEARASDFGLVKTNFMLGVQMVD